MSELTDFTRSAILPDNIGMSVTDAGWPAPQVRLHRPTLLWCYALLAPAMIFMLTTLDRGYQTDLWHHLARGRAICTTHSILNHDVFTYTVADQAIVDNNWLTQVIAYKLYEWGGIDLVQATNSILLGLTMSMLIWIGTRLGASVRTAGLIGAMVVAGLAPTLLIRPQTVSMLLFVLLMAVLLEAKRKPRYLLWAPLLMAVWANVHGAFPIGLVLIGCFTFSACIDRVRRLPLGTRAKPSVMIACLATCAAATLANPYGAKVYEYVLVTSSRASSRVIQEWLRPNVSTLSGAAWLASIVAMITLSIVGRRHVRLWAATVAIVFGLISCTSVRMSIWWYLAAAPIAMSIWPRGDDQPAKPSWAAGVLYAAIIAAMIISLPVMQPWNPLFLVRPSERLEDNLAQLSDAVAVASPGARVFSRLEWGEYLSFALPWKTSIFMDGRIEIYPDSLWDEYRRITSVEPDWQTLLDRHGVTVLLLDRHYHDGLILAAGKSSNWKEIASIGTGVIFLKNAKH